jgi:hypothetical protein
MIVTVHQPHYLPWLGYLHRMAAADLFILLDHVQFERGNYQNRTQILMNGAPRWLSVPVVQRSQKERITQKEVDNRGEGPRWWSQIHLQTLRHAYREAACVNVYVRELRRIFESRWDRLVDLNAAALEFLRAALGIRTPLVRSSELGVDGAKSELILNLCRAVGADTLLAGLGGSRNYLDAATFAEAGVGIAHQSFKHPVYPQCGGGPFVPGLSAVDLLFNCGDASRELLLLPAAQSDPLPAPHESRVAA